MFPFSHFFTGYIIGGLLISAGFVDLSLANFILFGVFSVVPDLDAIKNRIRDHHQTLLHAPVFWIAASTVLYPFSPEIAAISASMTLIHILCDFTTGRTVGVEFFYPSKKIQYSLYPLDPETAELDPTHPDKDLLEKHLKHYMKNKLLLTLELSLNLVGIYAFFTLLQAL
jgi:hypothetical protein